MDVSINCICPTRDGAQRHASDTVTLADRLDFRTLLTLRQSIAFEIREAETSPASVIAVLIEQYLLHCVTGWSLVDEAGKPVPVSRQAIRDRLLTHQEEAEVVGNAADNIYTDTVTLPLTVRASSSSETTPTPKPTSATNGHGTRPPKPSKPSSTSTTPMVATGPMAASPGGVSSSSQS